MMDKDKLGTVAVAGLATVAGAAAGWTAARAGAETVRRARIDLDEGVGAVPGDSTTSPVDPRPADMAAAPVGMAETDKRSSSGRADAAAGHAAPDLTADADPATAGRASEAFRPDPTAIPSEAEKEALRPATGPAPTLVADRGSGFSEGAGAA